MKPLTETQYLKLTKAEKEAHELKVREELIESGLIRVVKESLTTEVKE